MSLRTKILLLTVPAVLCLVAAFSALMVSNLIDAELRGARRLTEFAIQQTREVLLLRLEEASRQGAAGRDKWIAAIAADRRLEQALVKSVAIGPPLVEISVAGDDGRILVSSTQSIAGTALRKRPPLDELLALNAFGRMSRLLESGQDYALEITIGLLEDPRPIFRIQVLASTAVVKEQLSGGLRSLAIVALATLGTLLLAVSLLAGFVSRNLRRIEESIELIRKGEPVEQQAQPTTPEFASVQSKLNLLGAEVQDTARSAADFRTRVSEVLERLEEGILLFDAQGSLVLSGGASERMLGSNLAGFTARGTPLEAPLAEAFRAGSSLPERLIEWPRADGSVSLYAAVDYLSDNRCLVRLRDVEGRRQLESQLELLARLDGINRLTGGVAHEIKNPLNSIAAHLALLESMVAADSEEAEAEIRVIGEEVERLDRVVRTFLDFTRPVELAQARLDLCGLTAEVASFIRPDAQRKSVAVETHCQPQQIFVWADEDILRQALMNLAVNALDAMPNGGKLVFDLALRKGRIVELAVADTGIGIPPEKIGKIFQLYFTTKKNGSGVGLAMVYRAVQLHGGSITVDSEPGKGTRFLLTFPALVES